MTISNNTFPLPSGSDENPAVAQSPADLTLLSEGLSQEAAAGLPTHCECGQPLVKTKLGTTICAETVRIYNATYRETLT